MRRRIALLLGLSPLLLGWDHVISPDAFFSVNPRVTYAQVKRDPGAHLGTTLMLGGSIVENVSDREGTRLEIECYTLDVDDRPEDPDEACGRFLATTSVVLDPERYELGRQVTLTGRVIGEESRPLAGLAHRYVVFEIGEIHLWPQPPERWRNDPWYFRDRYWDAYWDPFCYPYGIYPRWRRYGYRCW